MKLLTLLIILLSSIVIAADSHDNNGHNNGNIITCSSRKNHRQSCYANTSGGVRLLRQISRSSCHDNWGYTHDQIWVDHGCRAEFELNINHINRSSSNNSHNLNNSQNNHNSGYSNSNNNHNSGYSNFNNNHNSGYSNSNDSHGNSSHGGLVVCESINNHRKTCSIPHDSRVAFSRQLSHSSCDRNWGYTDNSIWVSNGCRAEFTVSREH